jgi:uncharacterized membrane protein (DUF2068 family)
VKRPFEDFSWDLRACGRRGHVTYRPDEAALAERLCVQTAVGESWRCLRCGDYVVGPPRGHGPAADAPLVLRGRGLRDAFILRLLAVERLVRGLLLVALAYGIYKFDGAKDALNRLFREYLPLLRPVADRLGVDINDAAPVRLVHKALEASHGTLELAAFGVLAYGALELLEAVGLWLMRRWGEYVAVVGTGIFIPFEIYELVEKVTWLRLGAFVINVFAVVYILWTKRLFGVRGGRAAFERERQSESLLEIESTATRRDPEPRATQARE